MAKKVKNNRLIINLIACLVSFCVTMGINFLLTPYITEKVGIEAYGFVSLANSFVNYAAIITLALNSMASRFISVSYHKGENREANEYFNSVLITNLFLVLILFIPSIFLIIYLENVVTISSDLVIFVKILFALVFINFFIGLINTTFAVATFIKDRVDLNNLRTMESNLLKAGLMIVLFALYGPNIVFVGIAFLMATCYLLFFNIYYTRKLIPELKIKRAYFNIKKVITIFMSGIWNTVTKLGQVLADGLDLLVCNLFVNPVAMGELAVAKVVSTSLSTLTASLGAVFHPKMTYHYALDNKDDEINEIKLSMKIGAFFTNILLSGIIALGLNLFALWIPSQNIKIIYYATVVTIMGSFVGSSINSLFNVFTVTNKLKLNSLVTLLQGFLNVLIVYVLLKMNLFPGYEIVLISGISVSIAIIKNLTFTPMYAAKCLKVKLTTFYSTIFNGILSAIILTITFFIIGKIFNPSTWMQLIMCSILCGVIGMIENFYILFNKEQRNIAISMIRIKRERNKNEE